MTACDAATTPWFFDWTTTGKNPGTRRFSHPTFSVLSSPYPGFKNASKLESNQCFLPNNEGGIDTATCEDTQSMTWFGYETDQAPEIIPVDQVNSLTCAALSKSKGRRTPHCEAISHGVTFRGTSGPRGHLTRSHTQISGLNRPYPIKIQFTIKPF